MEWHRTTHHLAFVQTTQETSLGGFRTENMTSVQWVARRKTRRAGDRRKVYTRVCRKWTVPWSFYEPNEPNELRIRRIGMQFSWSQTYSFRLPFIHTQKQFFKKKNKQWNHAVFYMKLQQASSEIIIIIYGTMPQSLCTGESIAGVLLCQCFW